MSNLSNSIMKKRSFYKKEEQDIELHLNKLHENKLHENKLHENKLHENKMYENKMNENKEHENNEHENNEHENKEHENKEHENKEHENKEQKDKEHENKKHEDKVNINKLHENKGFKNQIEESKVLNSNKSEGMHDQLEPIKQNYAFFLLLAIGFGLSFMFCFYDFYENFNGILYPLFVISLFGFTYVTLKVLKYTIKKQTYFYAVAALFLGISSFLTMNGFIVVFNTLGIIILFTIFLCKQFYDDNEWGIFHYFSNIVIVWLEAIPCIRYIFLHGISYLKPLNRKKSKWMPVFKGVLYGGIFLCIVLPLLASADMVFKKFIDSFLSSIKNPFSGEWNYYFFLFIIAALMFYGLLCSFVSKPIVEKIKVKNKKEPTSAVVMAGLITATYILFCGIQIVYLFGGNFLSLPEGITYAKYAQQGFNQLLFVVMINIGLVVFCVQKFVEHKGLKKLLAMISMCTFIMIASAMYRMVLYISVYHLTFLRVLVVWFLIMLTILMLGVVYYIYHDSYKIGKYIFRVVLFCYFILAFMRTDYMIASYNIDHLETIRSEDAYYLFNNLSYDAAPALAKIETSKFNVEKYLEYGDEMIDFDTFINEYYEYIYRNYNDKTRSFNVSRYFAYQTAKEQIKER